MCKQRYIRLFGENIPVSEEVYREYYRAEWREKKQKAVHREKECSLDFMIEHDFDVNADPDQPLIDDIVTDKLMLEQLVAAIAELSEDERSIIYGLYFNEKTAREYARETGTNHSNVNRCHKNVIKKLRGFLKLFL